MSYIPSSYIRTYRTPLFTPHQNGTSVFRRQPCVASQGYHGVQVSPPTEHIKGLLLGPEKKGCFGRRVYLDVRLANGL